MVRLSTRWTNRDSYDYHMDNKKFLMESINYGKGLLSFDISKFANFIVRDAWFAPEDGDFPNYKFYYDMATDYLHKAPSFKPPLMESAVLTKTVKYLVSLAKQDPAYFSRYGGITYFIIKQKDRIKETGNIEFIKMVHIWWDSVDKRERTKAWGDKYFEVAESKYMECPFWTKSIDYILNWIKDHSDKFEYKEDYHPKKWYGCGEVGFVDNLTMGGRG